MLDLTTNIDARSLLKSLAEAGHVDAAASQRAESLIAEQAQDKELPLHLRILSGIGAFIAALCFIAFLAAAEIIRMKSGGAMIAWGSIFIGVAIALAFAIRNDGGTVLHSFLLQSSLSAMGVGKILFVAGIAISDTSGSNWAVTLGIFIVTITTYFFYRLSIDRFLSVLALLVSICTNLTLERPIDIQDMIGMNALFLAELGITGLFLVDSKFKRQHIVIPYAAAFALCFTVLHLILIRSNVFRGWAEFDLTFINYALTAALIGLIVWAAGDTQRLKSEPILIAIGGATLLGVFSTPGILLALCLLVVGYAKHEWILTILGIALMPLTIFHYYYSLELTLMMKSGILVGSGTVLLAGYAYMVARKIGRQVQP